MTHTLIIGGSGMLAPVTQDLARTSNVITSVGRSKLRLLPPLEGATARVNPIIADYRTAAFSDALKAATELFGFINHAVLWIHDPIAPVIASLLPCLAPDARLVLVLGSAAGAPNATDPLATLDMGGRSVSTVILGFKLTASGTRWLTNTEIADGVQNAIKSNADHLCIGTCEPWSDRP